MYRYIHIQVHILGRVGDLGDSHALDGLRARGVEDRHHPHHRQERGTRAVGLHLPRPPTVAKVDREP